MMVVTALRRSLLLLLMLLTLLLSSSAAEPDPRRGKARERGGGRTPSASAPASRTGRLFPVFQIVRFPNDPCNGGSKNGTCYTQAECSSRAGVDSGICAAGFGVCCVFNINCGATSSENCTYFESNAVTSGACTATICPCSSNVCQLRLDFNNFVISGPVTTSASTNKATGGAVFPAGAVSVSPTSQCLTDTFAVIGSGGSTNSDVICGTNTGEHLYVESDPNCNMLTFQLGTAGVGTALVGRQWSIKVTQYACDYPNLAPVGCDQFFFGSTTDTVRTFNYNGGAGRHLANQDQTICVRRERTNCRICWTAVNPTDFQLSGTVTSGINVGTICCSYGTSGAKVTGYDCAVIPGAETSGASANMVSSQFCGRSQGLVTGTGMGMVPKTVCSRRTPFYLRFRSDQYEFTTMDATMNDRGFQLQFTMDSINCN